MNPEQLREIEIQRCIYNFEQAVIASALNETHENTQRLNMAKADLFKMIKGEL